MTSEEFWTVPFKREVTNEDGHQFAGLIISLRSTGLSKKDKALRRVKKYFRDDNDLYNGPRLPDGLDSMDVIAKSEIHRSTSGEIFSSNIFFDMEHEAGSTSPSKYNPYSRYHLPEPENGESMDVAENRMEKLGITYR